MCIYRPENSLMCSSESYPAYYPPKKYLIMTAVVELTHIVC